MGYCNGDCEKLDRRYHRCKRYNQKLAYMKQSGAINFSVHEQCRECRQDEYIKQLTEELSSYRQAEEQGLLLRLPCKVGDTVFKLCDIGYNRHIKETTVKEIAIRCLGSELVTVITLGFGHDHQFNIMVTQNEFGKTVFLTKEAAEEALKEANK